VLRIDIQTTVGAMENQTTSCKVEIRILCSA